VFIVVSYDIVDDRRRARVLKTLKGYGRRVQYSVFECEVAPLAFKRMHDQLLKIYAPKEDNIRFYFLDEDAVGRIETAGVGILERAQPYRITD
jgi:CRISPR-associated protein Cas2